MERRTVLKALAALPAVSWLATSGSATAGVHRSEFP